MGHRVLDLSISSCLTDRCLVIVLSRMWIASISDREFQGKKLLSCMAIHSENFALRVEKSKSYNWDDFSGKFNVIMK